MSLVMMKKSKIDIYLPDFIATISQNYATSPIVLSLPPVRVAYFLTVGKKHE
jgi:hypothetical protein